MESTRESVVKLERPRTLLEFQKMNEDIYGDMNRKRYSDEELVRRFLEEILGMMEPMRKDDREAFKTQLPKIFSWYCALANRQGINLQEALWYKYPGVCPYCLRDESCYCGVEHPKIPKEEKEDSLRKFRRERIGREPIVFKDHQALHARLYKGQNARILPFQIADHIGEEAKEVSEALRHNDKKAFCDEMADVLSWLFAVATRLELSLDDLMWKLYPYECEKCHKDRCACPEKI